MKVAGASTRKVIGKLREHAGAEGEAGETKGEAGEAEGDDD